jgi:hypothetical protein
MGRDHVEVPERANIEEAAASVEVSAVDSI